MYHTYIYQPILNTLLWLYQVTGSNLGFAIILLTLLVRGVLIPFTLPQLKSAKKMAALKPELDALKKKHGHDAKLFQQKQMEFYKTHNVNPAAGCLPFIAQFIVLIALYQVFMSTLGGNGMGEVNSMFLFWDLKAKDTTYVLPVLAGILQFIMSLTILPAVENEPEKRPGTIEDKKDVADMATTMQQQMVFMMPIMTVIFSIQFPSGLALYWVITTAFFSPAAHGLRPGALLTYAYKFKLLKKGK
jgi:YidC/Oxa1 family membrane protein insertase